MFISHFCINTGFVSKNRLVRTELRDYVSDLLLAVDDFRWQS